MQKKNISTNRSALLKELEWRHSDFYSMKALFSADSLRYLWKRATWQAVIQFDKVGKRAIDIAVSSMALILLMPLFILVALSIKWNDRGPILFWQTRVGYRGREFKFPKFRSMVANAEAIKSQLMSQNQHKEGITFKIKQDPRITPIGRLIRKTSIDELPQLLCVLKGDMSLVGPRPSLPQEVQQYSLEQRRRLDAKPGLTCFWQVEGRGDIPFSQQVVLDVRYINSHSLWLDMVLLVKTVPAVIIGKGAY